MSNNKKEVKFHHSSQYLEGTDFILMTLLNFHQHPNEKRSLVQRYNIIMDALYGESAKSCKIQIKKSVNNPYPFSWEEVLFKMYEEAKNNRYRNGKSLAEKFIDIVPSKSGNKTQLLVTKYNAAKTKNKTHIDWVKFKETGRSRREISNSIPEDCESTVDEFKHFLTNFGWDWAFGDEDYDEDDDENDENDDNF